MALYLANEDVYLYIHEALVAHDDVGIYIFIYKFIYLTEAPSVTLPDITGSILKPTLAGSSQGLCSIQNPDKLVSDDLDSSLANLVGSEYLLLVACVFPCLSVKGCFICLSFGLTYTSNDLVLI